MGEEKLEGGSRQGGEGLQAAPTSSDSMVASAPRAASTREV